MLSACGGPPQLVTATDEAGSGGAGFGLAAKAPSEALDAALERTLQAEPETADILTFCDRHAGALLCADFDEGSAHNGFNASATLNGTHEAVDTRTAVSRPASMRLSSDAGLMFVAAEEYGSFCGFRSCQNPPAVTCAFDVRAEVLGSEIANGTIAAFDIETSAGQSSPHVVALNAGRRSVEVMEFLTSSGTSTVVASHPTSMTLSSDRWVHVELGLSVDRRSVDLALDGKRVLTNETVSLPSDVTAIRGFQVGLIVLDYAGTGAWALNYDNVICRAAQP